MFRQTFQRLGRKIASKLKTGDTPKKLIAGSDGVFITCNFCKYPVRDLAEINPLKEVRELFDRVRPNGPKLLGECPDCEKFLYYPEAA